MAELEERLLHESEGIRASLAAAELRCERVVAEMSATKVGRSVVDSRWVVWLTQRVGVV